MYLRKGNLGLFFHKASKDISSGKRVYISPETNDWPESWSRIEYKEYKDKIKFFLEDNTKLQLANDEEFLDLRNKHLTQILETRHSQDNFKDRNLRINFKTLNLFLNYTIGKRFGDSRMYPSGGARYPLEFYLLVYRVEGLQPGLYHYNVKIHALEFIKDLKDFSDFCWYSWSQESTVTIFFTSVFERTMRKYGERGYRYNLLEAGHVGQNMYLVGNALGLWTRAVCGTFDEKVESFLGIDGEGESLLYTICLG